MTKKLEFQRQGEGPTILFLHGLGSNKQCWKDTIENLRADFHCVTLDLYGHGENRHVPDQPNVETTAEEIAQMLQRVKWKPSAIVGHSLGGMIALMIELKNPKQAEKLVLLDTPTRQIRFWILKRMVMNTLNKNFDKAIEKQYAHMTGDMDLYHQLVATCKETDRHAYLGYMKSLLYTELHEEVKNVQIPIHLMLSRSLAPSEALQEKVIKKYGYDHLPEENIHRNIKSGHFTMIEKPVELAKTLRSIVGRSHQA
ncbi:Pimeloyl-ACP methyl ester carboxylesterase [Tindallia magadiensis]|uniref:Pimeloyl-ACP methyl ester carboxylesterase n=1 Tax=Tindallia magadiensis TaxID=69895 RepID=A0A1I3B9U1_9FIRM|nr:alpha/beta hydrolase [Tindallia magadiensis]SFH59058.1 Pimeloyl-ACP methyl ester carboxylesterase [Tindallia magadiensis]